MLTKQLLLDDRFGMLVQYVVGRQLGKTRRRGVDE
jgi:hypothetical protein